MRAMTSNPINAAIARTRIRTVLLALVGLPILAMVAALAHLTYRESEAAIEDAYRIAAAVNDSAATQTEEFLRRAENVLSAASRQPRVQALDPDNCDPLLAAWKRVNPAYANVLTLDATGRLVCSATPIAAGTATGPDPRYFLAETMRTRKFTVGKPAKGFVTGRWVSTLAYPILDADGRFIGVIGAAVDLAAYTALIGHRNLPPSAVVGIVNSEGTIIARSEDSAQRVGSVSKAEATQIMLQRKEGRIRSREYRGIDRFFVFTPIGRSDWIAWVSLDAQTVLAPAREAALQRLGLALALIVAVAALTIHVARRISNPIEAISNTLAAMRRDELHSRAPISGPLETQQIAAELNSMLDERRQAEEALEQNAREQQALIALLEKERMKLHAAQAVAKIGSWETNVVTGVVTWSQETYRIFEADPALFHPTHPGFLQHVHPEDRTMVDEAFQRGLASPSRQSIVHRIQLADGRLKSVEERWQTFFDERGQPDTVVGTCQDVTEHLQAEAALRESEERFRAVADQSFQGLVLFQDGITTFVNPAFCNITGYSREEALVHTPAQRLAMVHADNSPRVLDRKARYDRGETIDEVEEIRITRKDGQIRWVQSSNRTFTLQGKPARLGILMDITERKQAEAELAQLNVDLKQHVIERTAQLEQLRDLSQRLSELSETERRNISRELHDRVGPNLTALQLNLGMMQAGLPPGALTLSVLNDARAVLEQTIVQVRDVMSDLRPPALDDYGLVAAIRSYTERYAARLDAEVEVQGTDMNPRPSLAVETELFRIAQEALTNIAKHACAQHVLVAAERTLTGITLAITDDGVGFDSEVERKSGGMGLDTMRERAEALGAALRIESRPGGPTRIVVELACEAA